MTGYYYKWQYNPHLHKGDEKIEVYNLVGLTPFGYTRILPAELRISQNGGSMPQARIFATFEPSFTPSHLVTALELAAGLKDKHREAIDDKRLTEVKVQGNVMELALEPRI